MNITSQRGFSGIDERLEFSNDLSSAQWMKNFRVSDSGSLVRRQGIKRIHIASGNIEGIWCGNIGNTDMVIFAAGGKLYRGGSDTESFSPTEIGDIGTGECVMFEFGGLLYIKNTDYYGKYDGATLTEVEGYIPTVAISCAPDTGEGEIFEQINLITEKRRQLFSSDGSVLLYNLAEEDIKSVDSVIIDGQETEIKYSVDTDGGKISFQTAPKAGLNNVEITYSKAAADEDKNRIMGCSKAMLFGGNSDGRVFLWGNSDYPNYRFHSDLADGIPSAEYFPVNAFTIIGNSKINCIVQQYDKQLIFTESDAYYSYCELKDDGLGNTVSSFPVFSLNNGKGCIFETDGCVMDNKPVTLCLDGLNMWESTTVENEKNAVCFSMPIYKSMAGIIGGDKDLLRMFDFQSNRELYFIYNSDAYVYNYGNGSWYMYDDFSGDNHAILGRTLYFSRAYMLFAYGNELESDLEGVAQWQSQFITAGQSFGRSDLIRFDADLYIEGSSSLRFDFEKSGQCYKLAREMAFPDEPNGRYLRITLRPVIKRAMPFKITFTDKGPGKCNLHGLLIKTREKERSSRDGIL